MQGGRKGFVGKEESCYEAKKQELNQRKPANEMNRLGLGGGKLWLPVGMFLNFDF